MCPHLHEVIDDSGVSMCSSCPNHATKKVFDFSTWMCVVEDTGCPAKTVQTNLTTIYPKAADGPNADAKICAPCNERCKTCNPLNPSWCLTCADDLFTNEYIHTDADTGVNTTYIKCQEKCKPGTFPDSDNMCSGTCLDECSSCDDDKTCNKCKKGFFNDNVTDSENHVCVASAQCPAETFGNMMSGHCEGCDAKCKSCTMKATMCTECPTSKFLLAQHHKCFTKCPMGTYVNDTNCMPCQENLLNCNQTTGLSDSPMDDEHCAHNCAGCIWSKNYCIGCATGYKKASNGRCVMECPAGTIEREMNGFTYCKKCGDGCTRCIDEDETCSGESNDTNNSTNKEAKCIRCNRNLDYFLFKDQ